MSTARSGVLGTQWTLVKFPAVPIDTDAVFTAADGDKEINFCLHLTRVGWGVREVRSQLLRAASSGQGLWEADAFLPATPPPS